MSLESMKELLGSLERRELVGLLVVGALVAGGAGLWYVRSLPKPVSIQTTAGQPGGSGGAGSGAGQGKAPAPPPSPSPAVIVVDVAGFVNRPGVYQFHQGDRVIDAITRAGGPRKGADLTSVNLADLLTDGEQIVIVKQGAAPVGSSTGPGTSTSGSSGGASDAVNVNTATLDELETLPGIGEVLGQRIIDYREEHGPFQSPEDLLNVSGIGDARLADLKPHITV